MQMILSLLFKNNDLFFKIRIFASNKKCYSADSVVSTF